MEKPEQAHPIAVRRDGIVAKAVKVHIASAASVDPCGDAIRKAAGLGVNRPEMATAVVMAMDIDEPGRHELPCEVDELTRLSRVDAFRNGGDAAVCDRDILPSVQLLPRIQDLCTREEKIIRLSTWHTTAS
jgi:hypothetical protein